MLTLAFKSDCGFALASRHGSKFGPSCHACMAGRWSVLAGLQDAVGDKAPFMGTFADCDPVVASTLRQIHHGFHRHISGLIGTDDLGERSNLRW